MDVDFGDQKLDKQDQLLAAYRIMKWGNFKLNGVQHP